MVVAITIRNVPDEVREELAARAARSGRSLQEYLIAELRAIALRPTADDVIARARARVEGSGDRVAVSDILDALDADRK
jgi:hypothetical protein